MSTPVYMLDDALGYQPPLVDPGKLIMFPRIGCSIASIVLKRTYPIREIAKIYADCGVQLTTVNLLSAEWPTMRAIHVRPFRPVPEGQPWNLFTWNQEHFDRVDECREEMNGRGIVVQWCLEELYRWSIRKAGSDTPDARLGPFAEAWNVNGIDYVGPYYPNKTSAESKKWDSDMLAKVLPDLWEREYLARALRHLDLEWNILLCGNEFPEKSFHERVLQYVRSLQSNSRVSVNRNEETPGQYVNMKIGKPESFNFINHHGRRLKHPDDLDVEFGGNSNFPTFRHLLERGFVSPTDKNSVEQWRIIFSSDGARTGPGKDTPVNPYDWTNLYAFAKEVVDYGASFEHQSRAKLTDWPNLHMIETDFLTKLSKLVH